MTIARCETHGDYLQSEIRIGGLSQPIVSGCPKCAAAATQQAHREGMASRDLKLKAKGVPPRYETMTLASMSPKGESATQIWTALDTLVKEFETKRRTNSLIALLGDKRCAMVACATLNDVVKAGHTAMYTTAQEFIGTVRATYSDSGPLSESDVIRRYAEPKCLVINGLELIRNSIEDRYLLVTLMNQRYELMHPTLVVIKGDAFALAERLGDDLFSQFKEEGSILTLDPKSNKGAHVLHT